MQLPVRPQLDRQASLEEEFLACFVSNLFGLAAHRDVHNLDAFELKYRLLLTPQVHDGKISDLLHLNRVTCNHIEVERYLPLATKGLGSINPILVNDHSHLLSLLGPLTES